MTTDFGNLFLLNPDIVFLNHGSFGACPQPVFETYQDWQKQMERQPIEFLGRNITTLMEEARTRLADFLKVAPDEVVYFTNPTTAINMVARSLPLKAGDEILATDHEYGAMDRTWRFMAHQRGWMYVNQHIPLPIKNTKDFVEQFWSGVTPRTRVIFISQITSVSAQVFPVNEVCELARKNGLLTIIDGAHAPGQIPLDLRTLDADIYVGACHKWLCAPKGSAFLYANRDVQRWLDPLIVSWGYDSRQPSGSQFIDYHEWQGTRDMASFLTVPSAIDFQEKYHWDVVRSDCKKLLYQAISRIHELSAQEFIYPTEEPPFTQMAIAPLPGNTDLTNLKLSLYDQFRIEVPLTEWNNRKFIRVSVQAYNNQADIDALIHALRKLLAE